MMYPAIFSRTYAGKSAGEVFPAVKRDGYAATQMNLSSLGLESLPASLPEGVAEQAGILARATGVRISALSGTYNMAHPDAGYRAAMRPKFKNVLIAAKALGAPIVSLCTGSRNTENMWEAHEDNSSSEAWQDLHAEMEQALTMAASLGLVLAIEPEPGNIIRDAPTADRFLAEMRAPNLKIILDAANLLVPGELQHQREVMKRAVDLLGSETVLAHAKDFDGVGKVVAPGTGVVDLVFFAQTLKKSGYDGALIGHGFAEQDAKASAQVLAQLCA